MASFSVIYDACLLYPAPLRDLMIRLARTRRFRALWTDQIQQEWVRALLRNNPSMDEIKLNKTAEMMNKAVPDCLVTGYEHLIPHLELPDENDRHVLAAAIRSGAQAIITMNLKDFPAEILEKYGLAALHPDEFVMDLADLEAPIITTVAKQQRSALLNPPYTAEQFIETIRSQGLPGVAGFLEGEIDLI